VIWGFDVLDDAMKARPDVCDNPALEGLERSFAESNSIFRASKECNG